jgi:hypothetical protein
MNFFKTSIHDTKDRIKYTGDKIDMLKYLIQFGDDQEIEDLLVESIMFTVPYRKNKRVRNRCLRYMLRLNQETIDRLQLKLQIPNCHFDYVRNQPL